LDSILKHLIYICQSTQDASPSAMTGKISVVSVKKYQKIHDKMGKKSRPVKVIRHLWYAFGLGLGYVGMHDVCIGWTVGYWLLLIYDLFISFVHILSHLVLMNCMTNGRLVNPT